MPPIAIATLAELFAPVSVDRFIAEYWSRRSLFVRGEPAKVAGLLDLDGFLEAMKTEKLPGIEATLTDAGRERTTDRVRIRGADAQRHYAQGATVCAYKLHTVVPALAALCRSARQELGFTGEVDVRAYWSKHGEGFLPHFDARVATVIQLRGKKVWRFAREPSIAMPIANGALGAVGSASLEPTFTAIGLRPMREDDTDVPRPRFSAPPPSAYDEVELAPGDVLCLPPGTWHTARATGHSLALNLAFAYRQGGDVFSIVADALRSRLGAAAAWRGCPPPSPGGDDDAATERFFAERIAELSAAVADGDGLARAVGHAYRKARLPAQPPDPGFEQVKRWTLPEPGDRLRRDERVACRVAMVDDECWLYYTSPDGKGGLAFAGRLEPLVAEVAAADAPFSAAAMVGRHTDWATGRALLARLCGIGLLVTAAA